MTTTPDKYGDRYCNKRWAHQENPETVVDNDTVWCATCLEETKA